MRDRYRNVVRNVYDGTGYAAGYAELDWGGTYLLVRRDLPGLLRRHAPSGRALDFGCGAGRSTRLLRDLGYDVQGVDVSASMVEQARRLSPDLEFRTIQDGDFSAYSAHEFDLVLACFPFDNIPGSEHKTALLTGLGRLVRPGGALVNVVSSPQIYLHEWVSFTTGAFPENRRAVDGDVVKIVTKDFEEAPVCEDVLFGDDAYRAVYRASGLRVLECVRPLGTADDAVDWLSEREVAPWVLWALTSDDGANASIPTP